MNIILFFHGTIILILSIGLMLTTWKMFEFRRRLHELISNPLWEKTLEEKDFYKRNTIVLFGDSQIELWWMCPFFGIIPIRNRGISGEQASEAIKRFHSDVLNLNPDLIVIVTGANDLTHDRNVKDIAADIERMIYMAKKNSISSIVGSLLPFREGVYSDGRLSEIKLLNGRIQAISEKYNSKFIDFYSLLSDDKGFFNADFTDDGKHPNINGYFLMSEMLLNTLVQFKR